jgi:hypothetical protein
MGILMAIQNYGAIMQGAADLTAMPANAFAQGQQRRQTQEYRNALLAQDQQAQAFQQQRYGDEMAQADEDDLEWDDAFAQKDWARMARVDPQTTKILWEQEQASKPQPQTSVQFQDAPFGSKVAIGSDGRWSVIEPPKPSAPATIAPGEQFRRLTPEEAAQQGYPRGAVVQRNTKTGEEKVVSKQPPANANIQAKVGAVRTLNYVTNRLEQHLANIQTGGPLGVRGYLSKVTDSQDSMRFDNLKEQLSTELRTIFRIPGEGALSDREQAQYGLQLPDVRYDKKQNLAILADVKQRAALRIQQPDAEPQQPPQTDDVVDFNEY